MLRGEFKWIRTITRTTLLKKQKETTEQNLQKNTALKQEKIKTMLKRTTKKITADK